MHDCRQAVGHGQRSGICRSLWLPQKVPTCLAQRHSIGPAMAASRDSRASACIICAARPHTALCRDRFLAVFVIYGSGRSFVVWPQGKCTCAALDAKHRLCGGSQSRIGPWCGSTCMAAALLFISQPTSSVPRRVLRRPRPKHCTVALKSLRRRGTGNGVLCCRRRLNSPRVSEIWRYNWD